MLQFTAKGGFHHLTCLERHGGSNKKRVIFVHRHGCYYILGLLHQLSGRLMRGNLEGTMEAKLLFILQQLKLVVSSI